MEVLVKFSEFYNNRAFSDVELLLRAPEDVSKKRNFEGDVIPDNNAQPEGDEVVYANKILLAAHSLFFKALFTRGFKEASEKRVSVVVAFEDRDYFKDMIRFLYTGEFQTHTSEIFRVLHIADQFDMEIAIKEICRLVTKENLGLEECCDILESLPSGKSSYFEELLKHVRNIIKRLHEDLDDTKVKESFLTVNWRAAICILSNPNANVYSENTVFQLAKAWIEHQPLVRHKYAHLILHLVRYHLMTPDFLHCVVANNEIFSVIQDPEQAAQLRGIVTEAIYYVLSNEETKKQFSELRTDFRRMCLTPRINNETKEQKRYVKFEWTTTIPEGKEEAKSDRFFVHGYHLYLNVRKESEALPVDYLESVYGKSKYVNHIFLVNDTSKPLVGIVVPNFDAVKSWAKTKNIREIDDTKSLCASSTVKTALFTGLMKLAKSNSLEGMKVIKDIYIDSNPLDGSLFLPSGKINRTLLSEKYQTEINKMYNDFPADVMETIPRDDCIAVTLHIDSKLTGLRNTAWHLTQMHYKLYFKNLENGHYVGVGIVDHYWLKDSGWGKSVKSPGSQFVENGTRKLTMRVYVTLGKYPNSITSTLPTLMA